MNFEITDDFTYIQDIINSVSGSLDMTVRKPDGSNGFDVGVKYVDRAAFELYYGGAVSLFSSGYYYY